MVTLRLLPKHASTVRSGFAASSPRETNSTMLCNIESSEDALRSLTEAWHQICAECCDVLAGELHYQNMLYHALRTAGVPHTQLGMNVRQYICDPVTELYKANALRKAVNYRKGFECIPDAVIFSAAVNGDWRRRSAAWSVRHMLLAIEVKASERHNNRLSLAEIMGDINKLVAHRQEVTALGNDQFIAVMMVIDIAKDESERMRPHHISACHKYAEDNGVRWFYTGRGPATGACCAIC